MSVGLNYDDFSDGVVWVPILAELALCFYSHRASTLIPVRNHCSIVIVENDVGL